MVQLEEQMMQLLCIARTAIERKTASLAKDFLSLRLQKMTARV